MNPVLIAFAVISTGIVIGLFMPVKQDTPRPIVIQHTMTEAEKWNEKAEKAGAENDLRELRDSITQQRKLIFWNCVLNAEGTNDYCFKKAGL